MGVAVAYRPIVKRTEEQDLHRAVVELLAWAGVKGLVWYHVPNGELRPGRTGAILAGMGTRPGVADLALVLHRRQGGLPGAEVAQGQAVPGPA